MPGEASTWIGRWISRSQEEVPGQLAVAHDAEMWLLRVDRFRVEEEFALEKDIYESTRQRHRVALAQLIAVGEFIVLHGKQIGLPTWAKFTLGDIESTLDSLHVTSRCEHGPKNHVTTDSLIRGMFDVAK